MYDDLARITALEVRVEELEGYIKRLLEFHKDHFETETALVRR